MSVSVLFALVDVELFKSLSQEEIDQVTAALVAEIEADPQLKSRLTDSVKQSAEDILKRKREAATQRGD